MSTRHTPQFWSAIATPEPPDLGPGPRAGALARPNLIALLTRELSPLHLKTPAIKRLEALALLYHDHHDAAHDLVQDMVDEDGALIHAILHRREPDFWNARYWFRRVVDHPIYRILPAHLATISYGAESNPLAQRLFMTGSLDPFALVDLCEEASKLPPQHPDVRFLRHVQDAEFAALAAHLASTSLPPVANPSKA